MRYRIEFLEESTDEYSVCHILMADSAKLEDVERQARQRGVIVWATSGANGYQIRDLSRKGQIVSLAPFDENGGFWGNA